MQQRRAVAAALLTSILVGFSWPGDAAGAPRATPNKAKEVAQQVYLQGVDHYRAGRLIEAFAAFRASYEMIPSPNSHLMMARSMRDRGDLVDAYFEYGKIIVEADAAAELDPKYNATSLAARAERTKVRERLTLVTVEVKHPPADLRIAVGDRVIDKDSWGTSVPAPSGMIVARASSVGRPEQRQELVGVPGGEVVVSFDFTAAAADPKGVSLDERGPATTPGPFPPTEGIPDIPREPPPPPRPAPNRTLAFVSYGVGGAGLLTFVTFGAINQSIFNSLAAGCPGGHCPADRVDEIDRGRRAQVIANIGFGVALVGATLGSILLVNAGASDPKTDEVSRRPGRLAVTRWSVSPHAVEVGGEF